MTHDALNRFGDLEGIGPNMAQHLWDIGMRSQGNIAAGDLDPSLHKWWNCSDHQITESRLKLQS